jgi:hypothetical protein
MKVDLRVEPVTDQTGVIYYTHCNIQFNNEERAIIRERNLSNHTISFQGGYVDLVPAPPNASKFRLSGITVLIASTPMIFIAPPLEVLCWIVGPILWVYGRIQGLKEREMTNSITVGQIMQNSHFTVATFENAMASKILIQGIQEISRP